MTTIGQRLRQARVQRGLQLEDVFAATRIRRPYLQAMEADDWEALPSAVHARAFLRTYADFLGLETESLLAAWAAETGAPLPAPQPEEIPSAAPEPTLPEANEPPPADDPPPAPETVETPTSEETEPTDWERIFREIGADLRSRRELLGLSLAEVAAHTRVPLPYLQALEAGRFIHENLTPVQARGFLQQYADFIELDEESVLLRFAEGLQQWRASRVSAREGAGLGRRWRLPRSLRRLLSADLLLVLGLTLGIAGLLVWWLNALEAQRAAVQPTVPSISDVLLQEPTALPQTAASSPTASPEAAVTALPVVEAPTQTPTPVILPTSGAESVQLTVAASRRVWLRVLVDGREVLRERVAPGAAYTFGAAERIEVQTADAGALQIIYNGRDLGILGAQNALLTLVFSTEAVMTPTATVSPTPTITSTPTRTPVPSPTPRPSATPVP